MKGKLGIKSAIAEWSSLYGVSVCFICRQQSDSHVIQSFPHHYTWLHLNSSPRKALTQHSMRWHFRVDTMPLTRIQRLSAITYSTSYWPGSLMAEGHGQHQYHWASLYNPQNQLRHFSLWPIRPPIKPNYTSNVLGDMTDLCIQCWSCSFLLPAPTCRFSLMVRPVV